MATVYAYDGDGRRVAKAVCPAGVAVGSCSSSTAGAAVTVFVYDASGRLAAEYGGAANPLTGTTYLTADHLGSTRMVTDAGANVVKRYDYGPFGEELTAGIDGRAAPYSTNQYPTATLDGTSEKFTSKERDAETGLDFFSARYNSSAQGRFTSPDPSLKSAITSDPQTWSRYAYTQNNPLRYVDTNGKCTAPAGVGKGQAGICVEAYIAAPRVRVIGLGDNRGPVANDPTATFKYHFQAVVDPHGANAIVSEQHVPGTSQLGVRVGSFTDAVASRRGTESTQDLKPTKDDNGSIHFVVNVTAINGFAGFPGAPAPILMSLPLVVTQQGTVGVDPGGSRSAYPSLEIFSYSSNGDATPVLQIPETTPSALGSLNQVIPAVPPPPAANVDQTN